MLRTLFKAGQVYILMRTNEKCMKGHSIPQNRYPFFAIQQYLPPDASHGMIADLYLLMQNDEPFDMQDYYYNILEDSAVGRDYMCLYLDEAIGMWIYLFYFSQMNLIGSI